MAAFAAGEMQAGNAVAPEAAAAGDGLWRFALVALIALLALAAAAYALGRLNERRRHTAALFEARSRHQALLASVPGTVWRTDTHHLFVALDEVGHRNTPSALPAPPWSGHPSWLPLLQAQRGFAQVALQEPLAAAGPEDAAGTATAPRPSALWLISGQPMLDAEGRFAGFLGTACEAAPDAFETAAAAAARRAGVDMAAADAAPTPEQTAAATGVEASPAQPAPEAAPSTAAATELVPAASLTAGQATAQAESDEADNFSFTVAHDLRAPIRVVDGFTRIVKEDYGPALDRVANDHLDRVLNAAARMNKMIDALLTLASLSNQPLTRQPVDLSQIARYVIDELQRSQPVREVEVSIEEGLVVTGDPTLLRLVLENLLGNAWKYSSRTAQAQISLGSTRHGAGRAFVVRDNGAGFDMRAADRLFGVFQRLHSASEFPGHGVGLASARRIVRRHGGDIWAEAEPARGAAFSFTLAED